MLHKFMFQVFFYDPWKKKMRNETASSHFILRLSGDLTD